MPALQPCVSLRNRSLRPKLIATPPWSDSSWPTPGSSWRSWIERARDDSSSPMPLRSSKAGEPYVPAASTIRSAVSRTGAFADRTTTASAA